MLKQVNAVVFATISIIHMSNFVFLNFVKFCEIFNVKVFNLMSRTNETRDIEWHKTCKCKYKLDAST